MLEEEAEVVAEEAPLAEAVLETEGTEDAPATVAVEEDLLLEDLFEDDEDEEDEEDDEAPEGVADDSIWSSPIMNPDAGKIRFAEDFADEFRGRGRRGGRRKRGGYTPNRTRGAGAGQTSATWSDWCGLWAAPSRSMPSAKFRAGARTCVPTANVGKRA